MRDVDVDEQGEPRFLGLYEGVVVNNEDPLRVGRVTVMVPGVVEPESGWALPLGSPGGGSRGNGLYYPPKIGAEVGVMFVMGDVDEPRYLIGAWGAPGSSPESPTFSNELAPADAVRVHGLQSDRWEIVIDDRPGHESVRIKDRLHDGDILEIDGVAHGVTISGTAAVVIKSVGVVTIDALQVLINGRVVKPTGDPI